ncbi:MAG: tRNA epoxyqueuosine(34) reductase QueG [Betaproteobacteria bacterium]|nr:tRNA epoxyqueuosine(34) reductase QueG [Betaproteobacteria bacterium]
MNVETDFSALACDIKSWGRELGFQEIGIADTELTVEENYLQQWLQRGYHGDMDYMARHGTARTRPDELVPGTLRVVSVRLNYLAPEAKDSSQVLEDGEAAFISRYTLGRDYHKVLRARLQTLADRIESTLAESAVDFRYRVFTDSAPVMEVALARKAGLGWRGKHTLLLTRDAGSMFFLGELYTNLPLPVDAPLTEHCGTCRKCIDICPTQAIVAPYELDARRCISYLTIEHKGPIPEKLRPLLGNRIYGCDDCQLVCPWNKYAQLSAENDFSIRHQLDDVTLVELFAWTESEFNERMAGSAIRRIGHERWLRNIAVALGNALSKPDLNGETHARLNDALRSRADHPSTLVREHVTWALAQSRTAHQAR